MGASRVLSEGDFHNGAKIGPWPKGMTPGLPLKSIPDDSLLDALNVDIDNSGRVRTRIGFSKAYDGDDCRSLFSNNGTLYWLDGSNLMKMSGGVVSVVRGGYSIDDKISVHSGGGFLFMSSDTYGIERVFDNGDIRKAEPDAPSVVNLLDAAGTLDSGRYSVAVSYVDDKGIESAPSPVSYVDSTGGIAVSFAVPSSSHIVSARIYVSTANGSVMYKHSDVLASLGSALVSSSVGSGRMLRTDNWYSMPSVDGIGFCRGRLLGWSGKDLFFAEPFMGSLMSDSGGLWASFEEEISMVLCVEDGVYVGAGRTFFVSIGDDGLLSSVEVSGINAVKGTGVYDDDEMGVYWWAEDGLFFGGKGGNVKKVSSEFLAPERFSSGATTILSNDGIKSVVSSFGNNGENTSFRSLDFTDAEIVRRSLI